MGVQAHEPARIGFVERAELLGRLFVQLAVGGRVGRISLRFVELGLGGQHADLGQPATKFLARVGLRFLLAVGRRRGLVLGHAGLVGELLEVRAVGRVGRLEQRAGFVQQVARLSILHFALLVVERFGGKLLCPGR
jgi:hypothetical protein